MTTRRRNLRVPVRRPWRVASVVVALIAALALAGCTSSSDDWGTPVDPVESDDGEAVTETGAIGALAVDELILGDPAEDGEFAAVEPEAVVDLDPGSIPAVEAPAVDGPAEAVAPIVNRLAATPPDRGRAALDRVDAVDDGPTRAEAAADRDGNRRNELGELLVLDEPASLACADIEAALTALDEGEPTDARDRVAAAAERAAASEVAAIGSWSSTLTGLSATEEDLAELIGFLSACAQGGYEL